MTLKAIVEANLGPVDDQLWQEACEETTRDIIANRKGKMTFREYNEYVLTTYIRMCRRIAI